MSSIDELGNELRRLGNTPARLQALVQLGRELMDVCNQLGTSTAAAKPYLDEAVDTLNQAYAISQAADAMRGVIASMLGPILAARYGAHGGEVRDRETGISVMEEALSFSGVAEPQRATTRLALGQLYMGRVLAYTQSDGFSVLTLSSATGPSERAVADADRAIDCFRGVLDDRSAGVDQTNVARTLMGTAEAARTLLDAVTGGVVSRDGSRLTGVLAILQTLRDRVSAGGAVLSMDLPDLLRITSGDRPVPATGTSSVKEDALPDVVELRHSLYAVLPYGSPQGWPAAAALLQPDMPTPSTAVVDEMVALAQLIVDRSEPDEAQSALDHYFLAVALLLREHGSETSRGEDRAAGLDELLTAARAIPLVHPAALTVLRSLGAFVDEAQPLDKVLAGVAGRFADRFDSAILAGLAQGADLAVLDALRCLCRAAEALANLRRATGKVPADYPWPAAMAAARQLAAAAG